MHVADDESRSSTHWKIKTASVYNLIMKKPTIWIDADACPKSIKELIYRTSQRLQLPVILVANSQMQIPKHPLVSLVKVSAGDDIADQYIADHCELTDVIVTQDIPLAALIIKKGACAINSRGELYTEDNIDERLSTRDFMKELRDAGIVTTGPAPFNAKNVEQFANSLNKILTKLLKC
jgi:uncharacterized protein YaiI (UPF0178 family)